MGSHSDHHVPWVAEEKVFHLFPDLPKELRLQIWEAAVGRERLINISLKAHGGRRYELATAEPRYLERNHLRKPISGERYRAVAEGRQLNSKLLRVNRESREIANRFYRVQMPVYLTGPTVTERTLLLFNPEHDFLHIEADAPVKETLLDFLWDLKAYDPRDVGLLKLALDLQNFCANDLQYLRTSDIFLIRQRAALVDTLSQLRSVWFMNLLSSKRTHKPHEYAYVHHEGLQLSQAVPVTGGQPTLERIGADPRSGLDSALEQVYMGEIDPRELLFRWRRLLRTWRVEHDENQVEYRVVLATKVSERQRASLNPAKQTDRAVSIQASADPDDGPLRGSMAKLGALTLAGQDGVARELVAGYWLFPVEALGEIGHGDTLANMDFEFGRVLDMRESWPELVVAKGSECVETVG